MCREKGAGSFGPAPVLSSWRRQVSSWQNRRETLHQPKAGMTSRLQIGRISGGRLFGTSGMSTDTPEDEPARRNVDLLGSITGRKPDLSHNAIVGVITPPSAIVPRLRW